MKLQQERIKMKTAIVSALSGYKEYSQFARHSMLATTR
jgi:hypothetical protein